MSYSAPVPYLIAAGALLVLWIILGLVANQPNVLKWAYGQDGRLSTSKLQLLLWMVVVLYSFLTVLAVAILRNSGALIPNVPPNVLIALGFTGLTAVTAKGITVSQLQKEKITKIPASAQLASGKATATGVYGAVQEDDGTPDLGKIQMMAWTLVALAIYVYRLVQDVQSTATGVPQLPDIDPALMVLSGLSQGAYLGKKLVTTSTPQLFSVRPREVAPGGQVVLKGASLGSSMDGNILLLGGVAVDPDTWTDTEITFKLPNVDPTTNQDWVDGKAIPVQVISAGRSSVGDVTLVVRIPKPGLGTPAARPTAPVVREPEPVEQPVATRANGEERNPG